jgi:ubiquinone/menaquinone biosynthesis C-methylase UbiE
MEHTETFAMAFDAQPAEKMPGHWLLARLGKRVLRPGGVELTRQMLDALAIGARDKVVELAPGMGHTAERVLALGPASYIGVDRDAGAAASLQRRLGRDGVRFVEGTAEDTGLPGEAATVIFGEAMMSMHPDTVKRRVVAEAWRVLKRGGRYGIHELCVIPEDMPESRKKAIQAELARAIHHGVVPLTRMEWRELMESAGFTVTAEYEAPMHLLEPRRMIQDEGMARALTIACRMLLMPRARRRVLRMRSVFRSLSDSLRAVSLIAEKKY